MALSSVSSTVFTSAMALSKKTLELDTILVDKMFNRGVQLSTSVSYIPILNRIGAFSQLSNQSISSIFYNLFYGVNFPNILTSTRNLYELDINNIISTIQYLNIFTQFSNANNSTILYLSNYYSSIILNQYSTVNYNNIISQEYYNSISTNINKITSTVTYFSTSFYSTNFSPYASTLIISAQQYYSTGGTRDIQPGLSSIYTKSLLSNTLINTTYPTILSNTSTAWTNSNSSINIYRNLVFSTVNIIGNYIDTGSSISTLYYTTYSTLYNNTVSTSIIANNTSNIYLSTITYLNNYTLPTNGPNISSANSSIQYTNSTLNSILLENISTNISDVPLIQFSNIFSTQIMSINSNLNTNINTNSLFTISSYLSSIIIPLANTLSLSTVYHSYQDISSLANSIFANYLFRSFNSLDNYNRTLINLSINEQTNISTLLNSINSYITAPGISSIYNTLSTNTQLFYNTLQNTNIIPTISSLYISASTILNTVISDYSTINSILSLLQPIDIYIQSVNQLDIQTSTLVNLLFLSTINLPNISYLIYSTNNNLYPNTNLINTNSIVGVNNYITSTLCINISTISQYALSVKGNINIRPSSFQTRESIQLNNFNIYANDSLITPTINHTLSARFSTIIFNENFTILHLYNSTLSGQIGINTINPEFSLDIGNGDARKPSGSTWINPSDLRIKENIIMADSDTIIKEINSLRLVSYTWKSNYREKYCLNSNPIFGFISQEVETVFPNSIKTIVNYEYNDFRLLDIDQIIKAKYGLKQDLIKRVSTLQSKINSLLYNFK